MFLHALAEGKVYKNSNTGLDGCGIILKFPKF